MNKLEQYKDNVISKIIEEANGSWKDLVTDGFDAAIALDLPILFIEWCANNACWRNGGEGSKWYSMKLKFEKDKSTKELYQYWIENIYEPENK